MPSGNLTQAETLFFELAQTPPGQRASLLEVRCGDDVELRELVEQLLRNDDSGMGNFLRPPVVGAERSQAPPARIGRYEIVREIGRGGAGVVYEAHQENPARTVALKVLRTEFASGDVLRAFAHEAEILAHLQDPGIAQIYEAGVTEIPGLLGLPTPTPWFAMELVHGEPITVFFDREKMGLSQRLDLFIQVCRAVQHAHIKGIIHRDLKPSNVLAGVRGDQPFCKIIDFGIAKLTQPLRGDDVTLTQMHQWVGTPAYMSPEQLAGSSDIDTRSDVYALGVLLYEVLTGRTPIDSRLFRDAGFGEIQRIARETEPQTPSDRVASLRRAQPAELAAVALRRATDAQRLGPLLQGELDWITMRALEIDRARRYGSAHDLAADLERYLSGRAVEAAPPNALYRLRKSVRRHRVSVIAAGLVACSLLVGLGGAVWQARIAAHERDVARAAQESEQRQRFAAERVSEFLRNMLAGAGPEVSRGRDPTLLRALLDQAVAEIEHGVLRDAPGAEVDLRIKISSVFRMLGDTGNAARLLEPVESMLVANLPEYERLQDRYLEARANLLGEQGRHDEAIQEMRRLVELRSDRYGPGDARVAEKLAAIGADLAAQGKLRESVDQLREALQIAEAAGDDTVLANVLTNLADPLGKLGQTSEAVQASERALELYRRAFPGDHPHVANALNNFAMALGSAKNADGDRIVELVRESIEMKRRLFPEGHPHLALSMNNLGHTLQRRGNLDDAEKYYTDALAMLRKFGPAQDANVAIALINYSRLIGERGDRDRHEALASEALALCRRVHPNGHAHTAFALMMLGTSALQRGNYEDALANSSEAAAILERVFGPTNEWRADALLDSGRALGELGRPTEAIACLREAVSIRRAARDRDPAHYAAAAAQLVSMLLASDAPDAAAEAETLAREALEIRRRILPPDDWRVANCQNLVGGALVARAAHDSSAELDVRLALLNEAESMLTASFALLDASSNQIPASNRTRILVDAAARLARLYRTWDSLDSAAGKELLAAEWEARVATRAQAEP